MGAVASPATAPVRMWPAPTLPRVGGQLEVHVWDMHAARRFATRLVAAGVPSSAVRVSGRRLTDGLVEAEVRDRRQLTTRWRLNGALALAAAVVVGIPMGAALAMIVLGEHNVVMAAGAVVGGVGLAVSLLRGVWGDHFQRFPDTRSASRLEGVVHVEGGAAIHTAELLLRTTDEVMSVTRVSRGSGGDDGGRSGRCRGRHGR